MKSHIRKNIENKSIRESAGLFILGHEMKVTTDQITKDVLYTNLGNNHIPPLMAGKDEKGMSWIGEISSMVREILDSLRDVLSELPIWAKGLELFRNNKDWQNTASCHNLWYTGFGIIWMVLLTLRLFLLLDFGTGNSNVKA